MGMRSGGGVLRRVEACENYVLFIHNNRKKVQKRRVSFRTNPIQSWLCSGPVRYVRKGDKEGREGTGAEGRNTRLASEETHQTHNTRCDYPPLVCHCLVGTVVRTFAFCFAFVSRSLYCKHPMVDHPPLRLSCWGGRGFFNIIHPDFHSARVGFFLFLFRDCLKLVKCL